MTKRVSSILMGLGLLLLVAWILRVGWLAQSLRARLAQIENPAALDLASGCNLVWSTQSDLAALRGQVGGLIAFAPMFGWVPGIGGDLRAAPELLAAGSNVTEAGALICDALARAGANDGDLAAMARALNDIQPAMHTALAYIARAEQSLARVDTTALSPSWARRVELLARALPLARFAPLAPTLAGFDQPRAYLILALNEDELRPGGGFITGVGEVRVQAGRIAGLSFRDSYAVDDFSKPYPDPPDPLYRYMQIEQWVFRDSNWSPDFPTSARQAIALYRVNPPVAIDGVIALDQRAVQDLVSAIGPLRIADSPEPITGQNLIAYIQRAWAPSDGNFTGAWWLRRKSFMGPLADAARARIESGQFDKGALAKTMLNLLDARHVQIYFRNTDAASALRAAGWDGALRKSSGDFLMVVDANVGYGKVNPRIEQSLAYRVDLNAARPRAELALAYTHTVVSTYPCRPEIRYDVVYEQMRNRCYWNFARVYVAPGTQLDNATRIEIPATALFSRQADPGAVLARAADEPGFQSLEALTLLAPGKTLTREFALTLGEDVVQWNGNSGEYILLIQKQAGTPNYPVAVQVHLPDQTTLIDAQPRAFSSADARVTFQFKLERDVEIRVRFKRR